MLREARECGQNAIVHIKTKKGMGYAPAENMPSGYHSVPPAGSTGKHGFSEAFAGELVSLAENDERICAITAAMSYGTGLDRFAEAFPDRFFDVGIAEDHAVTFAAGLAARGMKPAVAIYSTFLQRAYDSVLHDAALQKLPVVIGVDRASLNASDGVTHHGIFDVSFLSGIPGVTLFAPATYSALRACLRAAFATGSTAVVRYPGGSEDEKIAAEFYPGGIKKLTGVRFSRISEDVDTVIVCHGSMASEAIRAADILAARGKKVGLALCEIIKPYRIPASILRDRLPASVSRLVFVEEEIRSGGFGMNLADEIARSAERLFETVIIAVDDEFVIPGKGQTVREAAGVDAESIAEAVLNLN